MEGQNQTSAETKRKGGFFARMTAVTLALAVIAASSVVLVVALLATVLNPFGSETIDRSGPTVLQQIRKLEEFTAAEGTFTQDVDLEEDAKYLPDFLSGQRVTALVTGSVRASVDFSQLDEDAIEVSDDGTTIRLTLPEPQLSDADIEESSARIINRNRGLIDRADDFFSENPTDDQPLYAAAEEKVAAAARESDLVEEARTNTEQWLTTFLGAAGFETVEVTWQDSPA
jgi:hypothetical protein